MEQADNIRAPYRMGEVKGFGRYFRFISAEYTIRHDPRTGKRWAVDRQLHADYQHTPQYHEYQESLLKLLQYDEEYDTSTPLELLNRARALKQRYFPEWWFLQTNLHPEGLCVPPPGPKPNGWHDIIRQNALFPRTEGTVEFYGFTTWQHCLESHPPIFFIPDDRRSFLNDLTTWVLPFYKRHQVIIRVKEEENPYTVSRAFALRCLELSGIEPKNVTFAPESGADVGIHHIEPLEAVRKQDGCIICKGIWNYFSLFRRDLPFLFIIDNQENTALGLLQRAYNPSQPESRFVVVGYQTRPFPSDACITGQDFNSLPLAAFLQGEARRSPGDFHAQIEQAVQNIPILANSERFPSLERHHGYFAIEPPDTPDTPARQITEADAPGAGRVYVQGVAFDPQELRVTPLRFDRLTLPRTIELQEPALLSNFCYFFTENLQRLYNADVPPEERLAMVNFPFDYIGERRDGRFVETVPLYRKGYFGGRDDGSLFIGYLTPERIECVAGNTLLDISKEAINPGLDGNFRCASCELDPAQPVYLFTPAYPERRVGQDRVNIVIVNETVVHIRRGEAVTIPPVGVVLSLNVPQGKVSAFKRLKASDQVRWQVTFQEDAALQKSTLNWLYGGYNLLIRNGENLAHTDAAVERNLRKEGWFLEQSTMTQETQLQENVHEPRCLLGMTEGGRIVLLTMSGRTRISHGANHVESTLLAQHLVGPDDRLVNLINLDGGASVFLEAIDAGQRELLTFPAPSDLNPAGVVRPNIAVLHIAPNS